MRLTCSQAWGTAASRASLRANVSACLGHAGAQLGNLFSIRPLAGLAKVRPPDRVVDSFLEQVGGIGLREAPARVAVRDEFSCPDGANLAGVERSSAWPAHPVRTVDFANREEVPGVGRFPPDISCQAAVIMLGANGHFQGFGPQINSVLSI